MNIVLLELSWCDFDLAFILPEVFLMFCSTMDKGISKKLRYASDVQERDGAQEEGVGVPPSFAG